MKKKHLAVHPGEILEEEFLLPNNLSQYRVAKNIGVSARRINEIVLGKRSISADTALRLGKFFGIEAIFWLNLQNRYDIEIAKDALKDNLNKIKRIAA